MTNIIFSFDTEDYVNPYGADGILGTSAVLREAGFRGCYNVVGLMAEALVEWGRQDAIDEIRKYHEVDYHSHRHSLHPSINEYTDRADFYAALEDFKADESVGLKKVCDIFKEQDLIPCTACRYCVDGCPKNILIPELFADFNEWKQYAENGNSTWYYDVHTDTNGKISDCVKCGKCEKACPQHLKIRDLLVEVETLFESMK